MDQLVSLSNKYIGPYQSEEEAITPSMINNYVKMLALPAPNKKRYSREHLARLIIICLMKRQLPISTISNIVEDQLRTMSIDKFYDYIAETTEETFRLVITSEDAGSAKNTISLAVRASAACTVARNTADILYPDEKKKNK